MRFLVLAFVTMSLGTLVSAAYSTKNVENHVAYAHSVSHTFAQGDFNDASGWRECVVNQLPGNEEGIVCEGTRSLAFQVGKRIDVNYFCEFRFSKHGQAKYRVESENCQ